MSKIQKNSIAIALSREMLLDLGIAEPTPEEAEQRRLAHDADQQREYAALPRIQAALDDLDAITDPTTRAILNLHARSEETSWADCKGCDFSGPEGEPPGWPCRTVELIAQLNDIDLSDFYLYDPTTEEPR